MIIEFYGVPGCGKSTAANIIENEYLSNKKIYSSYKIIEEIQRTTIKHYRLLNKNSPQKPTFKEIIELFMYLKNKKAIFYWFKLWIILKASFSFFVRSLEIMALYQFCEEYHKDEIVIVHHGIIQNLISFVYINPIHSMKNFSKYASKVIDKRINYVHIEIDVDTALIRLRNRTNQHGRLPKIKSDKKLLEVLYFQNGIFYYCDELIIGLSIKNKYKFNNNSNEENMKSQLFDIIKKCENIEENTIEIE